MSGVHVGASEKQATLSSELTTPGGQDEGSEGRGQGKRYLEWQFTDSKINDPRTQRPEEARPFDKTPRTPSTTWPPSIEMEVA